MMGTKERSFAPLINVSLEELVPQDHFYRHLERTLDLSFVREFVHETYCDFTHKMEILVKYIMVPHVDQELFYRLLA